VVCLALASAVSLQDAQREFIKFQRKYNKVYDANEFQTRFNTFRRNMAIAEEHQNKNPKATFGVTKFMDLSEEEFAKYYLMPKNFTSFRRGPRAPTKTDFSQKWTSKEHPLGADPNNWDWFTQGVCTPVYNQGQCGSCWAFSATETIESYYAIAGNTLTQLSMEQIVDCDTSDYGCNGGIPDNAYQYVENAGGLDSLSSYPYSAGGGQSGSCNPNSNYVATVSSFQNVNGEQGLYQQASTAGPVSVCVDASSWQTYQGGVLTSCTNNIDHCVQLTGYGNAGGGLSGYWIVRNSWGTDWGQSGFIWVQQGSDLCGIGDEASVVAATSGVSK
jgi:cathepsin F/cysteine peptidase B